MTWRAGGGMVIYGNKSLKMTATDLSVLRILLCKRKWVADDDQTNHGNAALCILQDKC